MKYETKRAIAAIAYLFGITSAVFGLGYLCGTDDGEKAFKNRLMDALDSDKEEEKPDHGRFEWGGNDEKPAIEWAEGGEEEFYKALEEADKEEENESES